MLLLVLLVFCALIEAFPAVSEELPTWSNSSLLWGPYRPNLYLGIRPRIPNSLLMGLMWSIADEPSDISTSMQQEDSNALSYPLILTKNSRYPTHMRAR